MIVEEKKLSKEEKQKLIEEKKSTFRAKKIQERIEKREERRFKRINQQLSEIEEIQKKLDLETPPCGHYSKITDDSNETIPINLRPKINFKELAISKKTLKGLEEDKKFKLTPIQRAAIPHALYNRDILGASKTGSGKTLAFTIPVLEKLFLKRWSSLDGLGALVILPTTILAIQAFEVFKTIGKYHDFSLGLCIGGNNLRKEQEMLSSINIIICTPGRLLQHITETPYFNTDNLQILVIDEADKILEDGFSEQLNEILSYLPKEKQTLMFSATLNKNIKSLAKFNLKCPEQIMINNIENLMMINDLEQSNDKLSKININVKGEDLTEKKNEDHENIMPKNLHQFYTIISPESKIDTLYSFLNTHKNMKIIVFLSSCKQVRFYFESFKRLKLGFSFLELHGGQKQSKRTAIFYNFLEKANSVLFATDIAARGMDFPCVNWVIQVDIPEDIQTYIHRVGRTARYKSQGNSLLFISEHEKEFLNYFKIKDIAIKGISINKDKLVNLQPILRSILSENKDVSYLAQRAIASYYKSIVYQPNKKIFDHKKIDIGKLSLSYGLMVKPKIITKGNKDKPDEVEEKDEEPKKSKLEKFKEKIKKKKQEKKKLTGEEIEEQKEEQKEDEFLRKKTKITRIESEEIEVKPKIINKKITIDESAAEERYNSIKQKLHSREEEMKRLEKERVKEKHQADRKFAKKDDYERHGIGGDSDEDQEEEEEYEDNNKFNKKNNKKTTYVESDDEEDQEIKISKEGLAKKILDKKQNSSKLLF